MKEVLEEIKTIDRSLQSDIKMKEKEITILEAQIEELYRSINYIQKIGELVQHELDKEE